MQVRGLKSFNPEKIVSRQQRLNNQFFQSNCSQTNSSFKNMQNILSNEKLRQENLKTHTSVNCKNQNNVSTSVSNIRNTFNLEPYATRKHLKTRSSVYMEEKS